METQNSHHAAFENAVRSAVLQQFARQDFVDSVTQAIVNAIEDYEDDLFAKILTAEPNDAPLANPDDVKAALQL